MPQSFRRNALKMLGNAEFCLDSAISHVKQRKQFGREIVDFQRIQWMTADMKVKLDVAQLLTYRAAANAHREEAVVLETSIAKLYVGQAAKEICDDCVAVARRIRLHGRISDRTPAVRYARRCNLRRHRVDQQEHDRWSYTRSQQRSATQHAFSVGRLPTAGTPLPATTRRGNRQSVQVKSGY